MPENNVIRPVFGGRKNEVPEIATTPSEVAPLIAKGNGFEKDVDYFLSNLERVWEAHLRGDEMTNFLFDDVGYQKADSSLDLRRPVVQGYTFEQFCDRLLGSTRKEWRAQPAFFGALFIEFHDRQNFILDSLEERSEQVKALSAAHLKIIRDITVRRVLGSM